MPDNHLPKIVAVVGPTASGKTALGVEICHKFAGEIVSADAKQVYRGMDIGTAKEKQLPVPQHLIDLKNPGQPITVAEYQALAYQTIDELLERAILPVLVGGSGLYVEAVTEGYLFGGPKSRRRLPHYQSLKIGIEIEREVLRERVVARTKTWLEQGLLEEIKKLQLIVPRSWLDSCGMEYRYFNAYLLGELTLTEAEEQTNIAINQYIKRQYTWWRRHADLHWVRGQAEAIRLVKSWLA